MKEDNIEKARRLLEECGDNRESVEIKQHSIYFTSGCYSDFFSKYIRQCKGVIVLTNHRGGFSIHKWGTHIGVPVKKSFLSSIASLMSEYSHSKSTSSLVK